MIYMNYTIRKRERKDCFDVANVTVLAWNETYKGIVPDEELNRLLDVKEEIGQRSYNEFDPNRNNKLVLDGSLADIKPCGFCPICGETIGRGAPLPIPNGTCPGLSVA